MQKNDSVAVLGRMKRLTVGITLNATFDASAAVGIGSIGGIRLIALMAPMVPYEGRRHPSFSANRWLRSTCRVTSLGSALGRQRVSP